MTEYSRKLNSNCIYQEASLMATGSRCLEGLPLHVLEDILLRLPVKALHRLCCISKSWYSLISQTSFHKEHYRRHSEEDPLVLVNEYDLTVSRLKFTIYNNQGALLKEFTEPTRIGSSVEPVQSCLGLVCLAPIIDGPVLLCDPSTRQLITLPLPLQKELEYIQVFGFGYDASKEKFKVVRFFCREADEEICCDIFTLGSTDGWRQATGPPFDPKKGVPLLHGALHLIPDGEVYVKPEDRHIVAFNLDTEAYSAIPLPEFVDYRYAQLVELGGSLCLVFHSIHGRRTLVTLWFLKNYSSRKWVKEYNIDVSTISDVRPLAIMRDGKILLSAFDEHGLDAVLCCYDPKKKRFGKKWHFLDTYRDAAAIVYKESFMHL